MNYTFILEIAIVVLIVLVVVFWLRSKRYKDKYLFEKRKNEALRPTGNIITFESMRSRFWHELHKQIDETERWQEKYEKLVDLIMLPQVEIDDYSLETDFENNKKVIDFQLNKELKCNKFIAKLNNELFVVTLKEKSISVSGEHQYFDYVGIVTEIEEEL